MACPYVNQFSSRGACLETFSPLWGKSVCLIPQFSAARSDPENWVLFRCQGVGTIEEVDAPLKWHLGCVHDLGVSFGCEIKSGGATVLGWMFSSGTALPGTWISGPMLRSATTPLAKFSLWNCSAAVQTGIQRCQRPSVCLGLDWSAARFLMLIVLRWLVDRMLKSSYQLTNLMLICDQQEIAVKGLTPVHFWPFCLHANHSGSTVFVPENQ